jgi:hypothetical protein
MRNARIIGTVNRELAPRLGNQGLENQMSALETIQAADITVQKLHAEAGFSSAESLIMRIKTAKKNLAAETRNERTRDPYRTQWQERVAAYAAHVEWLEQQ